MSEKGQIQTVPDENDNPYDRLDPLYQKAIDCRIDGWRHRAIAEAVGFAEQTVKNWFMNGGMLYEAYEWKKEQRKLESKELQEKIQDQILDAAVDAAVTLKTKARKGDVAAAMGILRLAGYEPAQKIKADVNTPGLDKVETMISELTKYVNSTTRLHHTTRFRFLQRDFGLGMLGGAFFQSRAGPFEVRAVSGVIPALVIADDRGNIRRMFELVINDLGDQLMSLGCGEGGAFFSNRSRRRMRNKWARKDCNM